MQLVREFTQKEELLGVWTAVGTTPAPNSKIYIVFKLPCDSHAMLLSIGYGYACTSLPCLTCHSSRPCIVHFSLAIVLRPLTACFPITTLLIFSRAGCIYQNIQCVQSHLQVKVIFQYSLCWFYQWPDMSVNNICQFNMSADHYDILHLVPMNIFLWDINTAA